MSVAPASLGWMAAVFDLKVLLLRKKNQQRATSQLVLVVDSKNKAVIDRLAKMTGTTPEYGRIQDWSSKGWMRRGCIEHCPQAHIHALAPNMPEHYRWTATGAAAAIVLHNLTPYLVADKPYGEFMDEALANTRLTGQGAKAIRDAMARLVGLGWELPPSLAEDLLQVAALAQGAKENHDDQPHSGPRDRAPAARS